MPLAARPPARSSRPCCFSFAVRRPWHGDPVCRGDTSPSSVCDVSGPTRRAKLAVRVELTTTGLQNRCSAIELRQQDLPRGKCKYREVVQGPQGRILALTA